MGGKDKKKKKKAGKEARSKNEAKRECVLKR